jgi:hypothetical protein
MDGLISHPYVNATVSYTGRISLAVIVGGAVVYGIYQFFKGPITNIIASAVEDGVNAILERETLKEKTNKFVADIVNDQDIHKSSINALKILANNEDTLNILIKLLVTVGQDPSTQTLVSSTIKNILDDPETSEKLKSFIKKILEDDELRTSAYKVIAQMFKDLTEDDAIKQIIIEYTNTTLLSAINDPVNERSVKDEMIRLLTCDEIKDAVKSSLIEVANREDLKKAVGDNAVGAVKSAIGRQLWSPFGSGSD